MKNRNYFLNKGGDDYFRRSIYGLHNSFIVNFLKLIKELKNKIANLIDYRMWRWCKIKLYSK